ncbi:hypothetical protein FRACYDRAFT_234255 [Fragilariopsis cylindrus CCMP1102]|uniref:Uncharacterized protein n=1 Tax=Fragilariopsis cylindrus CCMP1102 TaxID=635003 RepID=A0A1E7FR20_9STRA|nr:hypothetical protein FRACYDRAFT_234255 [Fragilariopsis cylindrus CCMP1102]|eukprot:OEU20622.1 hypothetical protein FRACYDRAFT_234255 [Fragilariopsis cylindrus CCMP1102]
MMKVFATLLAFLAVANAFAPMPAGRANTQLAESLFDKIFGMDLYAPVKDNNQYGTYKKKGLKAGKLSGNSYVPEGLTKAQYAKLRATEVKKKEANYQKNAKKAGIFEDYTLFYTKRGTDTNAAWKKSPTLGHRMAKTKYDFDTDKFGKVYDGNTK